MLGDTTLVFWAEDGDPLYQDAFNLAMFGAPDNRMTNSELTRIVDAIVKGNPVDMDRILLSPDNRFYILGLAPSAARLSVRFFLQNTFGNFLINLAAHYKRLKIFKPAYDAGKDLFVSPLVGETVNQNARDKKGDSLMAGALLRSILQDAPYPASFYSELLIRVNAEREVTWKKAAALKACLLKNFPDRTQIKEELSMPIDYEKEGPAYLLGCLLALLEKIQQEAIENIKRTLVDSYLSTACVTPALVFGELLERSYHHLQKVDNKFGRRQDLQRLTTVFHKKCPTFPERLDYVERGEFMVGYYMKRQELWTSKEDLKKAKEEANNG